MSRHQFRLFVVIKQLLVFGSIIVDEISYTSLPPELRSYLGLDNSVLNAQITSVTPLSDVPYWLGWLSLLTGVVASVGLCLAQRWGRTLYLATFLLALFLTLTTEFYLASGASSFVYYLAGTTEGMIIALVYFSPVRRLFIREE